MIKLENVNFNSYREYNDEMKNLFKKYTNSKDEIDITFNIHKNIRNINKVYDLLNANSQLINANNLIQPRNNLLNLYLNKLTIDVENKISTISFNQLDNETSQPVKRGVNLIHRFNNLSKINTFDELLELLLTYDETMNIRSTTRFDKDPKSLHFFNPIKTQLSSTASIIDIPSMIKIQSKPLIIKYLKQL